MSSTIEDLKRLSDFTLENIGSSERLIALEKEQVALDTRRLCCLQQSIESDMKYWGAMKQLYETSNLSRSTQEVVQTVTKRITQKILQDSKNNHLKQQAQQSFENICNNINPVAEIGVLIELSIELLGELAEKAELNEMTLEYHQLRYKQKYQAWIGSVDLIVRNENDPQLYEDFDFFQFVCDRRVRELELIMEQERAEFC